MPFLSKCPSVLIAFGLATIGCKKEPAPPPQANDLATRAGVSTSGNLTSATDTRPATAPATLATTQPTYAYLLIGDKLEEFPEARVRLLRSDDQVSAVVYTADPPTAIDNDYQGNSFYLTMPLTEVKDTPGTLTGIWRAKSATSDHQDTTEGIFLKGLRTHLQVNDVMVRVQQFGTTYQLQLAGQFLAFDTSNLQLPGVLTNVSGEITATTEAKK